MRHAIVSILCAGLVAGSGAVGAQQAQPGPGLPERIAARAAEHRHRLDYDGERFSGPAWDILLTEGKKAQFFLLGEEHGIAENPKLAAALFAELAGAGYSKFAIEVSPPMAAALDKAARAGVDGLRAFYATPGNAPAFYTMREEAEMLAAARAAAPGRSALFWGCDYEVGGDRLLVSLLEKKRKPAAATKALAALKQAQSESWAMFAETRSPQYIYSFAGDPALVRAVRDAWPAADAEARWILDTLEETFEINRLWVTQQGWASNERRSAFLRDNFLRYWRAERAAGGKPKVFAKFGASHLVRGRNMVETYDLGALLHEIAAVEGERAFSLLVLPGEGASTAVFNPMEFRYAPSPPREGYREMLGPIGAQAYPDAYTFIDLRPLRPLFGRLREGVTPEMMRIVHGFDAVLVLSGSTPSENL